VASSRPLTILVSYTRVRASSWPHTCIWCHWTIAIANNSTNVLIDRCRIYNNTTGTGVNTSPIYLVTGTTNSATIRNCVIYGSTTALADRGGDWQYLHHRELHDLRPNATYASTNQGT